MTRVLRLALGGCLAVTGLVGAPAHAGCFAVRADRPHAETKADGSVVVEGYGGAYCGSDGGTASVCLDFNGMTRTTTCRTYTGTTPMGPTGEAPCQTGVWQTRVVVVPNVGSPSNVHSDPFVQICSIADS